MCLCQIDKHGTGLFLASKEFSIFWLSTSGGYSNLGARGKNFQKLMLSEKKKGLIWACIFFTQNQSVL